MSRALQLFHSIYSFYLPFMFLRWLPHSVLQIGEYCNMFLFISRSGLFFFVYVKPQLLLFSNTNFSLMPNTNFSLMPNTNF